MLARRRGGGYQEGGSNVGNGEGNGVALGLRLATLSILTHPSHISPSSSLIARLSFLVLEQRKRLSSPRMLGSLGSNAAFRRSSTPHPPRGLTCAQYRRGRGSALACERVGLPGSMAYRLNSYRCTYAAKDPAP